MVVSVGCFCLPLAAFQLQLLPELQWQSGRDQKKGKEAKSLKKDVFFIENYSLIACLVVVLVGGGASGHSPER